MKILGLSISVIFFLMIGCSGVSELSLEESFLQKQNQFIDQIDHFKLKNNLPRSTRIQNISVDHKSKLIKIDFNRDFSYIPLREENVKNVYTYVKEFFGEQFEDYNIKIVSINFPIEELIPNFYRTEISAIDSSRLPKRLSENSVPVIKNSSKLYEPVSGLIDRNVLLWHSHGWYYNNNEKRWMWQRARLFQSVEDTGPLGFTIPFLIPMLENAGANVFVPRERDIQLNEVIVDNNIKNSSSYSEFGNGVHEWKNIEQAGFGMNENLLAGNENPFKMGTGRFTMSANEETATVKWSPDIPQTGEYAVYISYISSSDNISDAKYDVYHSGGITRFIVNQKIGGGTWLYLGTFKFKKGKDDLQGITLSNRSSEINKIVSADAVRFGGGVGIIQREGKLSNRPKFTEASRYWLQFAGMPDTLVYSLNNNSDDYKDDYQSRAEYGNYLIGNPFGPNKKRDEPGLGIPIDVSLAFHTDAGITRNDTVIGTLMIYSTPDMDSVNKFPDGVSRLANRDLADIVQSQITHDIRMIYDSAWSRRQLMDAMYSEAARPNFPSMLLELLSHQNFLDMKFHLDPRFRFDASRAIYKGILKFLSCQYGFDYVVQPLPVTHFAAELIDNKVHLSWRPEDDPLESTAKADKFIVYTRIDDNGFDNGILVEDYHYITNELDKGKIYSFKVTAINEGGESFPSEVLSAGISEKNKSPFLIVSAFDRVSPPESIESEKFSGFLNFLDEGVPYKLDYGYTGIQFNFDPDSKWMTDDNPGHGASASDYETMVIAGNTFDFSYIHGKALLENDYSFCSVSDESVYDGSIDMNKYKFIDFIFGEEKKTNPPKFNNQKQVEFEVFPVALKQKIKSYIENGGKLFLSGSYIGSDLYTDPDSSGIQFANNLLKIKFKTGHAVRTGMVYSVKDGFLPENFNLEFNTNFNDSIYKVEAPDEIGEINDSKVLLRYAENNFSAAVGYKGDYGIVTFGFPFETILDENTRKVVMKNILNYLEVY